MVQTEPNWKALAGDGLVEHATKYRDGLHPKANDPPSEDIYDGQNPITLEQNGFRAKQVDAPQAVFGLAEQGEPGWSVVRASRSIMGRQNPPDHVLVNVDSEGLGDLLGMFILF